MAEATGPVTPIARSPIMFDGPHEVIDGWEVSTRTSDSALTIADESHLTKVVIRAAGAHPLTDLLPPAGRTAHVGGTLRVGSAPSEWYLLAAGVTPDSLVAGLVFDAPSAFASWVDVTHGRALMRITGTDTTKMLAKQCAVNLADSVTPNGAAFRTAIAGVTTDFIRDDRDDVISYLIHCERSSGQYLFGVLTDAGAEFGIDPVGVARQSIHGWSPVFGRGGRADPQPTEHVSVLLASTGGEFRPESIALSATLANRDLVGVLIIARIYGSSFGLPNPGLLPTKKERQTAQDRVDAAIDELLRLGVRADGQIMMTRNIASSISRVARARTADRVIVEAPEQGVIRGLLEGNFESSVRRKLRGFTEVTSASRV